MSPSEFWRLHPREIWWLIEAKTPKNATDFGELYDLLDPDAGEKLQLIKQAEQETHG